MIHDTTVYELFPVYGYTQWRYILIYHHLKLDLCDKTPTNKLKIRILSETSIPYLIRHASFILIVSLHL